MRTREPAIGFILATVFLDALGIGLIVPVLPGLIGTMAGSHDAQTTWYGIIMLSYGMMQFIFAPILGALSDRVGRRPVLLTGIAGLSIMMVVPAISTSLIALLISRLIGGMMSSNMVVAQAYIADVTPAERRGSNFGKIGAIFGIAFVLGPAMGGILGQLDIRLPFVLASLVTFINFLYGFFVLPESLKTPVSQPLSLGRLNPFKAMWRLVKNPRFTSILIILALYWLAQSLMQTTWALYTQFRFHWTPLYIGLSIFALGISISLTQGVFLPRIASKLSPWNTIRLGLIIGIIAFFGMGISPWGGLAFVFVCLLALAGIINPTVQGIVSRYSSKEEQGVNMGAVSSLGSFMGAISPLIGSPLLLITTNHPDHPLLTGAPYYLSGTLLFIGLGMLWYAKQKTQA